jgi:hypothetical protein
MRQLLFSFILLGFSQFLFGQPSQNKLEGNVNYMTSQNIYVKFQSTNGINKGDTIYYRNSGVLTPAFVVENLSSVSCSGKPVGLSGLKLDDKVEVFIPEIIHKPTVEFTPKHDGINHTKTLGAVNGEGKERDQRINGRISVSSYQNYSNTSAADFQKMRYTLSFNGKYLANSRFSLESYISFAHRLDQWAAIQDDIFNGLKIYDLALNYEISKMTNIWLGRKINPKISSIGAIDGVQVETGIKKFFL